MSPRRELDRYFDFRLAIEDCRFEICNLKSAICNPVADADPEVLGRGQDQRGQATKGVWGMSRRQKAMKGVEDCDKPGGAVKRALSPGCPNYRALNP